MGKYDTRAMAEDARLNTTFGDNGGLVPLRISRKAYINAVLENGPEITTARGKEYWADQVKKFPHLATSEKHRHTRQALGKSRFGKATATFRGGQWLTPNGEPVARIKARAPGYVLPSRCQE
jgi:hypothetical protein